LALAGKGWSVEKKKRLAVLNVQQKYSWDH